MFAHTISTEHTLQVHWFTYFAHWLSYRNSDFKSVESVKKRYLQICDHPGPALQYPRRSYVLLLILGGAQEAVQGGGAKPGEAATTGVSLYPFVRGWCCETSHLYDHCS